MLPAVFWQEDDPSPAPTPVRPVPPPAGGLSAAVAAALWRGDQLGAPVSAVWPSGFAALDAQLPGGGWPGHGLTEILTRTAARWNGACSGRRCAKSVPPGRRWW